MLVARCVMQQLEWEEMEMAEYRQLVKGRKGNMVVVDEHGWLKELEEAPHVSEMVENNQVESGDDEL